MDNNYLNNAVVLSKKFSEATNEPYYGEEVDNGDREAHCYFTTAKTMFMSKILKRIEESAPEGADLTRLALLGYCWYYRI